MQLSSMHAGVPLAHVQQFMQEPSQVSTVFMQVDHLTTAAHIGSMRCSLASECMPISCMCKAAVTAPILCKIAASRHKCGGMY